MTVKQQREGMGRENQSLRVKLTVVMILLVFITVVGLGGIEAYRISSDFKNLVSAQLKTRPSQTQKVCGLFEKLWKLSVLLG